MEYCLRQLWYQVEEGYLEGSTNLSFCLMHGVKDSTCLWAGSVPGELESWLGPFSVSTLLRNWVLPGILCLSDGGVVYPIEC